MRLVNHQEILSAIEELREVRVTFRSKEDAGAVLVRRCAPMDYGPSTRVHDKSDRYHFWDFESDSARPHVLSLVASQIISVEVIESLFEPSSFVEWRTSWRIPRTTWGSYN